jgi:Uma2 family endonuclease
MQLEVESADAVLYPDVMVTCDSRDLRAERTLHHPLVVIEVLSESTAAYDRGQKFALYRQIDALQEYALVDPEQRTVEVFRRTETSDWLLAKYPTAPAQRDRGTHRTHEGRRADGVQLAEGHCR